jgi:hypothetical protein
LRPFYTWNGTGTGTYRKMTVPLLIAAKLYGSGGSGLVSGSATLLALLADVIGVEVDMNRETKKRIQM